MGTLKLNNIRKSYGQVDIIKGIDLDVRDGELVVFVGPSGCGKSTLLRIIAGLEDANSGEICIDDQVVNQIRLPNAVLPWCFRAMRSIRT